MNQLINQSIHLLNQLMFHLNLLNDDEYKMKLNILSDSSIGQHVRHVFNFFEILLIGIQKNKINYDNRIRDTKIEEDKFYAINRLNEVASLIENLEHYKNNYIEIEIDGHLIQTSISRELHYINEHSIHHFAIMKIGFSNYFPHIQIDENFGLASSTIEYKKNKLKNFEYSK